MAVPGLFAAWQSWRNGQRDQRKDRTDLVKIAQEAAGSVIHELRQEAERLRERLDEVEADFASFRRAHDGMIADRDAELALLRGENRQLKALAEAYERLLEANNIPHEKPAQPFWKVEAGRLPPREVQTP